MKESHQILGKPLARVDALAKVTGKAIYAADVSLPGTLYLKVFRSNRPHAKILGIHTEKAKAFTGVVEIYTSRDIPGLNRSGVGIKDQPILCDEKVRRVGDPVALVAAETTEIAAKAAGLIEVDYEDLPAIFSFEEALASDAVKIHESGNLLLDRVLRKGDPDQALRDAEIVTTNTYRTQMVEHAYTEPEAGVAAWVEGKVNVWMPSKYIHDDHKQIAAMLGVPIDHVRCILTTVGGCFGDKHCVNPGYYAALVSAKTRRPAKMVYDREESFIASTKRHPFVIDYTTGATREGRITAVKVAIKADGGAYASYSVTTLMRAMIYGAGPYDVPNVLVRSRVAYTNNPIAGAMRGFGVAQIVIAHESQMDILAETLKMDPFEIRLKNGLRRGSCTATGQKLENSVGLAETIRKVRDEIAKRDMPASTNYKKYGWGIASMFYGCGKTAGPNPGCARIAAEDSGKFVLYLGCGDGGQGIESAMIQIAAETLNTAPETVRAVIGDTEICPDSGTSSSSRTTYIVGRAVQLASELLRESLRESAALLLGAAKQDVAVDDETFYLSKCPTREVSISEVVSSMKRKGIATLAEASFDPETTALDPNTGQGNPYATYAFATQAALISVDMQTGGIDVLSVVAAHDVGKAVNPLNVTGQIEGGVAMGIGYALLEHVVVKDGTIRNPQFTDYIVPTVLDVPEITSFFVEREEPTGPFGAKGVGEPALLPTAPAIMNAVAAATGVRLRQIPITPEALFTLLQARRRRRKPT
ncbi:MAG TPA: xanthine dehydrogenase family protein molybdopterin-binding subunit [Terriglobales bacterium]|nr:xanthine dehydrogenase family protein molybdopterin-binding subunit [Terriglobales bacterium]